MNDFQMTVKEKAANIILVYLMIFVPMWAVFLVNNGVLQATMNQWGISPRHFSTGEIGSVLGSWLLHGNYEHILGNSIVLVGLLGIVGLLESKVFKLLGLLIASSGFATWLLGMPGSVHVGASGLVFALFGYILSASTLGRKWIYLLPIALFGGTYYYSIYHGLIPQRGVSFAAHFGGFIAGIIIGYYFDRQHKKQGYSWKRRRTLKDWWFDITWDIKYQWKRKFGK